MFKYLTKKMKNSVVYLLIVILGLPLSVLLGGVTSASAAAKTKTVATQNTSAQAVATATDTIIETDTQTTEPTIEKMKFVGEVTGLFRSNSYVTGQTITMDVVLAGAPVNVWAQTGILDSSFPENTNFENYGNGKWHLETPVLTENLNEGSNRIVIYAQDAQKKTIQTSVQVNLSQFKTIKVSSYKVSGDGSVNIAWKSVPLADAYLVNWQIKDDNTSNLFSQVRTSKITIEDLQPGTSYEVRIQPLRGDAVGEATKLYFKSLGIAPVKVAQSIAGESSTAVVTPAIGDGVSISKPTQIAANIPFTPEIVTPVTPPDIVAEIPSPSPSASEEPKTETSGWNKLLLALSILIIATAVAIGGYYAYEKIMLKSKDKEPDEPDSNSRW